jgi:hypothetical protein
MALSEPIITVAFSRAELAEHRARSVAGMVAVLLDYKRALGDPQEPPAFKPPSRSTLHDEVVTLRLVLKTAIRHGWLDHLPDLSPP